MTPDKHDLRRVVDLGDHIPGPEEIHELIVQRELELIIEDESSPEG